MRSDAFPGAIEPVSPSRFITRAAPSVAIWSAFGAGIPAATYCSSSLCRLKPGERIGARHDRHAGVIEHFEHPEHRGVRVPVALVHPLGDRAGRPRGCSGGPAAGRRLATSTSGGDMTPGRREEHLLEHVDRRVEDRVVLLEQPDERPHPLGRQIQLRGMLGDGREARGRAGIRDASRTGSSGTRSWRAGPRRSPASTACSIVMNAGTCPLTRIPWACASAAMTGTSSGLTEL